MSTDDASPDVPPTDAERWIERWEQGTTAWHLDQVNPALETHAGRWSRVLVPLCGASLDVAWLAERGMEVVGVELAPQACRRLFEQWGVEPTIDTVAAADQTYERYRAKSVTVLQGDMLALQAEHAGSFDGVWDRGALVALPPELRAGYLAALGRVAAGAQTLLATFLYEPEVMEGPPHSISDAFIEKHFEGAELLATQDMTSIFAPERAEAEGTSEASSAVIQRIHRAKIRAGS